MNIKWIDSEELEEDITLLYDVDSILIPGGFGERGIKGKLEAIKYARENNIPMLGICLGMQLSIVEFARHVIGWNDAHSAELDPSTTHPVIHLMPDQDGIEDIGGTLRLGSYPCMLASDSKIIHGLLPHRHIRNLNPGQIIHILYLKDLLAQQ